LSTAAVRFPRARSFARSERLVALLPLLTIYLWLCLIYGWEAWGNLTPWLFTDELEQTQFARAIAATGHAARRGVPHAPDSIYPYLIAPAWWIHNNHTAYGIVKGVNVVVMTASIFPAYALARMLVSPRAALLAATTVAAVPAFAYSSLILQEPVAYTWSILCVWLAVRALVTPTRGWVAAAIVCALVAPAVRGELIMIPAALLVAVGIWWFIGEGGRTWRRGWSRWDWTGFAVLAVGVVILFNSLAAQRSYEWWTATQHYKDRMLANGMWAIGALVIGLGVLPFVAGLAALFGGRWSTRPRAERAFMTVAAPTLLAFGWYTAVKAAYISTVFSTLVEERNAIYAAPILILLMFVFFERRRTHVLAVAGIAAFAFYLIVKTPFHMYEHFYADAPGLSILQSANRVIALTPGAAQIALLVILAGCVVFVLALALRPGRWVVPAAAVAGTLVLAWNLTGEITGARASHEFADQLLSNFPRPLDWVDHVTHGKPTPYYGQRVSVDPNGVWLLEFWNRSLEGLWTLDSSGVGPGPTGTPDILKPTGEIKTLRKVEYAVADNDVNIAGTVVARKQHLVGGRTATWTVYKVAQPLRLEHNVEGIFPDGWAAENSGYSQFATPHNARGFLRVTVSRLAGGKTLPANVQLRVGKLVLGKQKEAKMGEVLFGRSASAQHDLFRQFVVDAPPAPFRAEVRVWPPFRPVDLDPRNSDIRELGAQVSYEFVPRRPPPVIGKAPEALGVYSDTWMGADASYTSWFAPGGSHGRVRVTLSRPQGPLPARARISIGRVGYEAVGGALQLGLLDVTAGKTVMLTRSTQTITVPAPPPPYRVEVHVSPTFVPARVVPGSKDERALGARVSFAAE
jgi:hypothetical protein